MGFLKDGYSQVEINQMSFQKTGQIFASLPLDKSINVLQNGVFMYYDYATGTVNGGVDADGDTTAHALVGEPMLVYNEIKLYRGWEEKLKDFAMKRVGDNIFYGKPMTEGIGEYLNGEVKLSEGVGVDVNPAHTEYPYRMNGIYPRVVKTNVGDIFTTNALAPLATSAANYEVGDYLTPTLVSGTNSEATPDAGCLVLTKISSTDDVKMIWQIVKVYTMPDGQTGFKVQRVQ